MSLVDRRRLVGISGTILLSLALAGCFRPLYGPSVSGPAVGATLAAIDVAPIADRLGQERVGYYLQQELRFDLDGGVPVEKRYRLELSVSQAITSPIVDTATGRADSATLTSTVGYVLKPIGGEGTITQGTAVASATYDRNPQRFASVRAARDAEIRAAKTIADQIRIRLATALSAR